MKEENLRRDYEDEEEGKRYLSLVGKVESNGRSKWLDMNIIYSVGKFSGRHYFSFFLLVPYSPSEQFYPAK